MGTEWTGVALLQMRLEQERPRTGQNPRISGEAVGFSYKTGIPSVLLFLRSFRISGEAGFSLASSVPQTETVVVVGSVPWGACSGYRKPSLLVLV